MGKLFSIDGIVYKIGTVIIDLFYMNLLWAAFTIIGFGLTGGASTTALFHVMLRRADNKGSCNFREFLYGFKKSFKNSTIVWVILLSIFTISFVNINNTPFFQSIIGNIYVTIFLFVIQVLVMIELMIISIYIFGLLAQNDMSVIDLFKVALILGHKHLLTTLTCIALLVVAIIGLFHVPILFFAGISGYALLTSLIVKEKIRMN